MRLSILLNIIGIIVFAALLFLVVPERQVHCRMKFVELDRAGVINESALDQFHPSYDFKTNIRANVPDYITTPAISGLELFAKVGLVFAILNLILSIWATTKNIKDSQGNGASNKIKVS